MLGLFYRVCGMQDVRYRIKKCMVQDVGSGCRMQDCVVQQPVRYDNDKIKSLYILYVQYCLPPVLCSCLLGCIHHPPPPPYHLSLTPTILSLSLSLFPFSVYVSLSLSHSLPHQLSFTLYPAVLLLHPTSWKDYVLNIPHKKKHG